MQAFDMAHSYKPVAHDQLFLLPPDIRQWLSEDHLAFFVLEVLEGVDTAELHDARRLGGAGRQAYDPDMLLGLLVYSYCTGERSSGRIERLCEVDVAFRVIASNQRPDHSTIARFRADNEAVVAKLFTKVLALCHEAGLVSLAVVAIDGTKMKGDASKKANRTHEQLKAEAERILKEAAEVDAREDELYGEARGDEIAPSRRPADPQGEDRSGPRGHREARGREGIGRKRGGEEAARWRAEGGRRRCRRERAPPQKCRLARVGRGRAAKSEADYTAHFCEWKSKRWPPGRPASRTPPRTRPKLRAARRLRNSLSPPTPQEPRPVRVNITDPDSHMMKSQTGWVQGYNAQAAVDEGGVVLSARVTNEPSDVKQCQPMMAATRHVSTRLASPLRSARCCSTPATAEGEPHRTRAGPPRPRRNRQLSRAAKEKGFHW